MYLVLCFVKRLPWLFIRNLLTEIKISFYRNIAILCGKNVSCEQGLTQTIKKICWKHVLLNDENINRLKKNAIGIFRDKKK